MEAVYSVAKAFANALEDGIEPDENLLEGCTTAFEPLQKAIDINLEISWKSCFAKQNRHMDVLKALSMFRGGLPFPSIAALLVCHAASNMHLESLHIIDHVFNGLIKANFIMVSITLAYSRSASLLTT